MGPPVRRGGLGHRTDPAVGLVQPPRRGSAGIIPARGEPDAVRTDRDVTSTTWVGPAYWPDLGALDPP